jgi:hypothetical protein
VEKIDAFELYDLGRVLRPLTLIYEPEPGQPGTKFEHAHPTFILVQHALEQMLQNDRLKLRQSVKKAANELLELAKVNILRATSYGMGNQFMEAYHVGVVQDALTAFENVLKAELPELDLYLVTKKGGYDTSALIDQGEVFFPSELAAKVPEAIPDIKQGMRCVAFELPTAAGYHLHRANEAVLRRYWDVVTNKAKPPPGGGAGQYLNELEGKKLGDPKLIASLKDLVKWHRNPLAHPDQSLENVNEAIALQGSIHTVIVHMLKVL